MKMILPPLKKGDRGGLLIVNARYLLLHGILAGFMEMLVSALGLNEPNILYSLLEII